MAPSDTKGALDGLLILDLSRILAGPTATQLLGDMGATVIKIENPKSNGDATRAWGPPYAEPNDGQSDLSAYFMSSNRNKYSVSADLSTEEGRELVRAIAAKADVVIENYKPGGLEKYGFDHATLCAQYPALVYLSISGFGQDGPNRNRPGYDLMAQGYGGIMSLTGPADGQPMKVGVGIADVMCGMYATIGILAALRHRDQTGEGQYIDLSLVAEDARYQTNPLRIENRETLIPQIAETFAKFTAQQLLQKLQNAGVPCGPIYNVEQALTSDQAQARGMVVPVPHADTVAGEVSLLGNPLKFSATPVTFRRPPPRFGQDTQTVIEMLDIVAKSSVSDG